MVRLDLSMRKHAGVRTALSDYSRQRYTTKVSKQSGPVAQAEHAPSARLHAAGRRVEGHAL
jgi:hypothetical protein